MNKDLKIIILVFIAATISAGFIWFNRYSLFAPEKVQAEIYAREQMQSCYGTSERGVCYKKVAINLLDRYSLKEILKVFDENEKRPEFFENCHEVSHYLGQEAYKRTGDLKKIFSEGSRACLGGVYHGAVEGYFMAKNIAPGKAADEEIKNEVSTICGKEEDHARPQDFTECSHGLGHALMYLTDYDLPKALDYCDFTKTRNEQELCYTGALMSNGDSLGSDDHQSKYVKADDPLYPCAILKKQQQKQCYVYGTLTRFQYDLPKSIDVCLSIPKEFQNECFATLGRDRTMTSEDPEELKSQCSQIKQDDFREQCIGGTSYNLVVRFGTESNIPSQYCSITDEKFKESCYSNMLRVVKRLTGKAEDLKVFCGKITDEKYKKQCLDSI